MQLWGKCNHGGASWGGTIFVADSNATYFHPVYSFTQFLTDPIGSLVLANNGKFYGVTLYGGLSSAGNVYAYNTAPNIYTNIHNFFQASLGWDAQSGMIKTINGLLYGMCQAGGANDSGVIYKIDPVTDTYTDIYDFDTDGAYPLGTLTESSNGKLYGMTYSGGASFNGVIFSFDPSNSTYIKLHDFDTITGIQPYYGGLIQASNSKLYGLTYKGGLNGWGVLFSFDLATGVYTDLFDFDLIHGAEPLGSLIQATDGLLYGMTSGGGSNGKGVLFSFDIATNNYTDLFDFDGINGMSPDRKS